MAAGQGLIEGKASRSEVCASRGGHIDMMELYLSPPAFGLPAGDADSLATLLLLQAAAPGLFGVRYIPSGKLLTTRRLPSLHDPSAGVWVSGFDDVRDYLDRSGLSLDDHLTKLQTARLHAYAAFVAAKGTDLTLCSLFAEDTNYFNYSRALLGKSLGLPWSYTRPDVFRRRATARAAELGIVADGQNAGDGINAQGWECPASAEDDVDVGWAWKRPRMPDLGLWSTSDNDPGRISDGSGAGPGSDASGTSSGGGGRRGVVASLAQQAQLDRVNAMCDTLYAAIENRLTRSRFIALEDDSNDAAAIHTSTPSRTGSGGRGSDTISNTPRNKRSEDTTAPSSSGTRPTSLDVLAAAQLLFHLTPTPPRGFLRRRLRSEYPRCARYAEDLRNLWLSTASASTDTPAYTVLSTSPFYDPHPHTVTTTDGGGNGGGGSGGSWLRRHLLALWSELDPISGLLPDYTDTESLLTPGNSSTGGGGGGRSEEDVRRAIWNRWRDKVIFLGTAVAGLAVFVVVNGLVRISFDDDDDEGFFDEDGAGIEDDGSVQDDGDFVSDNDGGQPEYDNDDGDDDGDDDELDVD